MVAGRKAWRPKVEKKFIQEYLSGVDGLGRSEYMEVD